MTISDDWHLTQNSEYLNLQESRLKEAPLIWCSQFAEILNSSYLSIHSPKSISINDYGCAVGHFARVLPHLKCADINYLGIDISETYLDIAKNNFIKENFMHFDLNQLSQDNTIRTSDVAVMSATLEHLENYQDVLNSILARTRVCFLLRTFTGESYLSDYCAKDGSSRPYLIQQFEESYFFTLASRLEFKIEKYEDQATGGREKLVCVDRIIRKQSIYLFYR